MIFRPCALACLLGALTCSSGYSQSSSSAAAADSSGASLVPADSILDGFAGMWEGQFSGAGLYGVDRLIASWKYDRRLLQLQSRATTGPRKEFEVIAFIRRDGDIYSMNYVDATGQLAHLDGRLSGRVLEFEGEGPAGRLRLRYDFSRPKRLALSREEAYHGSDWRKIFDVMYARGRVKRP